jgi:hypothetical protein
VLEIRKGRAHSSTVQNGLHSEKLDEQSQLTSIQVALKPSSNLLTRDEPAEINVMEAALIEKDPPKQ